MMGEMNAKTCTRPGERARHIHERAMAANYAGDVFLREFKIACMPELVAVQGRVLPTPLIQYGMEARNTQVTPNCGQWTLRDTQLHTPGTLSSWAVINTTRAREDQVPLLLPVDFNWPEFDLECARKSLTKAAATAANDHLRLYHESESMGTDMNNCHWCVCVCGAFVLAHCQVARFVEQVGRCHVTT